MPIFRLKFPEYTKLITALKLDQLNAESLGLITFPLANRQNIERLYNEYLERDDRLETYLGKITNCQTIVFAEASRTGNRNYIYRGEGNVFHFNGIPHNYFNNVTEAQWYNSLIIDFFSPIGINHTSKKGGSRDYLNKQYLANYTLYENYVTNYINSILQMVPTIDINNISVVIAAPKRTRDSILGYLRRTYNLNNRIKCYRTDKRGVRELFDWL